MDVITATVRVRAETDQDVRPTRDRMQLAADCLRSRGFDVLHIGRFGVNVRAARPLLERELGVQVTPHQSLVAAAHPPEPNLAQLVDHVEIALPAELFKRSSAGP